MRIYMTSVRPVLTYAVETTYIYDNANDGYGENTHITNNKRINVKRQNEKQRQKTTMQHKKRNQDCSSSKKILEPTH